MVQVLRNATPTARKAHTCDLCGGPIQPGEQYDRQTNIYDGRVYDYCICVPCRDVVAALVEWFDDYLDDEGYGTELADEWARDAVRVTGSPVAAAYLTRRAIAWRECVARIGGAA